MKYLILEEKGQAINLDNVEMVELEGNAIGFRFIWGGSRHIEFENAEEVFAQIVKNLDDKFSVDAED